MKKHTKVVMDFYGYGLDDIILCGNCKDVAVDVHHIDSRGMGGSKCKDYIENLIPLCRTCHDIAHSNKDFNNKLKIINLQNILTKLFEQ